MTQLVPSEKQSEAPALPKLAYTMREAAAVIGVSYMSMHRLVQRGLIRSSSPLRTKIISHAELLRFLAR